jgi:hypothetical protein
MESGKQIGEPDADAVFTCLAAGTIKHLDTLVEQYINLSELAVCWTRAAHTGAFQNRHQSGILR